ncbi:MAG: hypothetical protein O3B72_11895, partial [Proteobacteria bacterium]|nr:hypothetical protein [Pseudomonadota bacterium]
MFLLLFLPVTFLKAAGVSDTELASSIVSIQVFKGREVVREGSGFVVQSDRFSGYLVTNAELVSDADSLTVRVPGSGGQLVGQVQRADLSSDFALVKV